MKVQIIVGSTRAGRVSDKVAKWVELSAKTQGLDVELVDLIDYDLPFFDEPISPQYNPDRKPSAVVQKWLDKVAAADGYILVTPEYNRSYPAVLKNALDYLDFQFARKPVAIVAHGSTGGAQAVAHLRGVLPGVLAFTVPQAVLFSGSHIGAIDETGELSEELRANPYGPQSALEKMLGELKWYGESLKVARP